MQPASAVLARALIGRPSSRSRRPHAVPRTHRPRRAFRPPRPRVASPAYVPALRSQRPPRPRGAMGGQRLTTSQFKVVQSAVQAKLADRTGGADEVLPEYVMVVRPRPSSTHLRPTPHATARRHSRPSPHPDTAALRAPASRQPPCSRARGRTVVPRVADGAEPEVAGPGRRRPRGVPRWHRLRVRRVAVAADGRGQRGAGLGVGLANIYRILRLQCRLYIS